MTAEMLGIILGIVSVVPVLTLWFNKAAETRRKSRLSYLWTSNDHGWAIVKPQYEGRKARIEDVLATQKLRDVLAKNKLDVIDIDDDKPIPADRNLILICGPEANKASKRIAPDLQLSFEYRYDKTLKKPHIFDHATGLKFFSPSDESGELKDVALLAKLSSKAHPYVCVLCWGLHGPGTTGAAQMLLEPDFIAAIRKHRPNDDFVSVIGVPYKTFDAIDTPKLITLRKGNDAYRDVRS